jgi:hypothetical protein
MRVLRQSLMFTGALFVLIALSVPDEGTPIGASGIGDLPIGNAEDMSLSIEASPKGAAMNLVLGTMATSEDSMKITGDGSWKLAVADSNAHTSNKVGKIRKGSWSGEPIGWIYNNPNIALTKNFAVLVRGIGNNGQSGEKFNTLTDATDLSSPVNIVIDDSTGSITIDLKYSQEVVDGDAEGDYRIDLTYSLSSNP